MLQHIALGSALMAVTTALHALCTVGIIKGLRSIHAGRLVHESAWWRVTLLSMLVLVLFLTMLVEVNIWAVTYLAVGAMQEFEPALYFSTVTFTTLGYGDLTLDTNWRLLGSFEAANGTIMFGWTTAIVVAVLHGMLGIRSAGAEAAR